ncbi:MAG: hypothetical protein EXQ84_02050 [Rhodospirillaceae bacterium]|nr:hypothetical protein [Rhodospirillaceae bacterium]
MRTMTIRLLSATALAASLAVSATAQAAPDRVGETQMCVPMSKIDETPIIDNKTILLKMRGRGNYKRIDLMGPCSGLTFSGYVHVVHVNQFCTSDPLRVLEPVGAVCMIDKIVNIDEAEAKELLLRGRRR